MAGSSLFALLDDIATMLDDISLMTKVAAKKTAGVLGDDLALNAQQVSGVRAERELPIVWQVAKGSFRNKLILVPAALLISATVPALIGPLLVLGGLFLCYEGVEKVWHYLAHRSEAEEHKAALQQVLHHPEQSVLEFEQEKIKGAIRTDFILSAEIIVIALGTASHQSFMMQAIVVSLIALVMTIGVYGLVALIVKLDDIGLHLMARPKESILDRFSIGIGRGLLAFCPWLMKALSVVGTAAMFLVGGGILAHQIPALHHWQESFTGLLHSELAAGLLFSLASGILSGAMVLVCIRFMTRLASAVKGKH